MVWFKVDDSFYDHPKVFDAPDCAVALWTRAGTWSARNLTNGFVPTGMPARLCDDPDTAVKELVRRGLWLRATGGWKFHDWATYQPSKESVEDLRAKRAEAGRKGGEAKAANAKLGNGTMTTADRPTMWKGKDADLLPPVDNPLTSQDGPDEKQNASKVLASASPVAYQNAAPARPGPSPSGLGSGFSNGDTGTIMEPPSKCDQHTNDPDPPPCRACKTRREAHEAWEQQQLRADQLARSQRAHERAETAALAIRACDRCDHLGKLANGLACNHQAEATPGAANAAREAARAAAARRPAHHAGHTLDDALAEVIPLPTQPVGEDGHHG